MKLVCKIGTFRFMPGITLGSAKLIRDTVIGMKLIPTGGTKLKTAEDCHKYAEANFPDAKRYLFNVELVETSR